MNEQQTSQSAAGERVYERCLCREAIDRISELLMPPEAAREHLRNSRIEFLKAIRSVIDERIAHLSAANQQGTKVNIE